MRELIGIYCICDEIFSALRDKIALASFIINLSFGNNFARIYEKFLNGTRSHLNPPITRANKAEDSIEKSQRVDRFSILISNFNARL